MTDPESTQPSPPLPELHGLDPGELLARGLRTAEPSPRRGRWVPPTPEELAKLLPQYRIERLLGHGGMGAVYQGKQVALDRPVAIKILSTEFASDQDFVARFQREARTLARLHHSGIVAIHDFGQTTVGTSAGSQDVVESVEGHLYFVMEYVDGTDLAHVLRGPGLKAEQALELIAQICDALHYAHRQGVIHRDIKPSNILLTRDGRAKVADFGLARPLNEESETLTQTHAFMGTPGYMAPEQRLDAAHVDHRSDIFALGVMLYEMLTGQRPAGAFEPPSRRVQVDVRIDEVVLKALQQEPDRRYQEASEMKTDVDRIRTTQANPKERQSSSAGQGGGNDQPAITNRRSLALALLLLAALAAGGWFVFGKKGPAKSDPTVPPGGTRSVVSQTPAGEGGGKVATDNQTAAEIAEGKVSPSTATKDTPPAITIWHDVMDVAKENLRKIGKVDFDEKDGWVVANVRAYSGFPINSTRLAATAIQGRFRSAIDIRLRMHTLYPGGYYEVEFGGAQEGKAKVIRREYDAPGKNTDAVLKEFAISTAAEHEFLITMIGDEMRIWVDGALAATVHDTKFTEGTVGLSIPKAGTALRDFAIAEIPGPSPERIAAQRVLEMGGTVNIRTPKGSQTVTSAAALPERAFALERIAMDKENNTFGDSDMVLLMGLPALESIRFNNGKITGASLGVISTLPKLSVIEIDGNNRVRDEDLAVLKDCRPVKQVSLKHLSKLTPAVLEHLAVMPALERLDLAGLRLNEDAVATLLRMRNLKSLQIGESFLTAAATERLAFLPELEALSPCWKSLDWPINFSAFPKLKRLGGPGEKLTPDVLKSLATATKLESLIFGAAGRVDAEMLASLGAGLKGLKTIEISPDGPLARGLPFAAFPKLETVTVIAQSNRYAFDDAILLSLADVAKLKRVTIHSASSKLTSQGVAEFRKLRPDVSLSGPALPPVSAPAASPFPAPKGLALSPATATKDAPFVNTLGLNFVPVPGTKVLFCTFETRVRDYTPFAAAKKVSDAWKNLSLHGVPVSREPDHPVSGVTWEEAKAFCQWLTAKEVAEGTLQPSLAYRLPTDDEWSRAVGLPQEVLGSPKDRSMVNSTDFPWGKSFPPKELVGNYRDETYREKFPDDGDPKKELYLRTILNGYHDGFATTAPVGSFPPNALGLFDMGGNVTQWVEDLYESGSEERVARGGSWFWPARDYLLSSCRSHARPDAVPVVLHGSAYGFRLVLAEAPAKTASGSRPAAQRDATGK